MPSWVAPAPIPAAGSSCEWRTPAPWPAGSVPGEALLPRILTVDEVIERLEAVTIDDLLRVAQRYLAPDGCPPRHPGPIPLSRPLRASDATVTAEPEPADAPEPETGEDGRGRAADDEHVIDILPTS